MLKRYDGLDLMKFIASIFVVAIHTKPLADISFVANTVVCEGIARLGVPLFFLTSAFFYGNQSSGNKVLKYLKRMGLLYLCWFVIMIPITIYDRFIVSTYSLPITIFRFIRSFFITSTFSGSWFLCSCVFSVILFSLLDKFNKKISCFLTFLISIISYLLCVFTSAYGALIDKMGLSEVYNTYELFFANPYTSFLVGVPYFAIGKYFSKNDLKIRHINLYAVLTFALLILEIVFTLRFNLHKTTDCYFMLLPCSALLFLIVKNLSITIKCATALRKTSTIIFFSHFIWIFLVKVIQEIFSIEILCFFEFLITIILSFLTAKIILVFSNQSRFKFLKYLY